MKRAFLVAALAACVLTPAAPASAQVLDRDVPVEGAATLRINVSGPVHLMPQSGLQTIKLHAVDYGPKTPPLHVTTAKSGSRLTLSVTGPSQNILPFVGATGYELQINYPASLKIDLREFTGRIHVDRVTAPMQLYNANGAIVVDDASAPLTAEADLGDITVGSALGMIELTCGTGNAIATLASGWRGNLVRMESSTGNLTLNVPSGFRARFDVTSASGNVSNPLRSTPHAPLVFMLAEQGNIAVSVSSAK